ncbi:hypothetical protein E2P81_ATG07332 [Venturia nashicola]|nr:hypothetical protein E2P81_ATG07332 [Venturia nashicola]
MASATKADDDEIKLIIARAAMSVPLPSLNANKEPPRTKGEQMKLILENMRFQHDQIRKQIFAQCPRSIPRSTIAELRRQAFDEQRSPKGLDHIGKGILELLRAPYPPAERGSPKFAQPPVVEPNQPYGKPLPQTQGLQMQPFLHELAPVLQALDTFNLHAFNELVYAEKEKEKLEANGTARTLLANATAKKRSAHDTSLDKSHDRPPMKRFTTSSLKDMGRLVIKRSVSFTPTKEEIVAERRRNEKIELEQLSPDPRVPTLPTKLPNRPETSLPAPVRDPGLSNTDNAPNPYAFNVTSNHSQNNRDSRTNDEPDTRGMYTTTTTHGACDLDRTHSSSPNGNVHASRMNHIQSVPSPFSPANARQKIPRPSSRDPRLAHRNPLLPDRR